jgi:hypothetical protein
MEIGSKRRGAFNLTYRALRQVSLSIPALQHAENARLGTEHGAQQLMNQVGNHPANNAENSLYVSGDGITTYRYLRFHGRTKKQQAPLKGDNGAYSTA